MVSEKEGRKKNNFWNLLQKAIGNIPKGDALLIMSDFSAKLERNENLNMGDKIRVKGQ